MNENIVQCNTKSNNNDTSTYNLCSLINIDCFRKSL